MISLLSMPVVAYNNAIGCVEETKSFGASNEIFKAGENTVPLGSPLYTRLTLATAPASEVTLLDCRASADISRSITNV